MADIATLQARLDAAETAYDLLMTGGKPVTLNYDMGTGKRSVTYSAANIGALAGYIASLRRQIDPCSSPRRAIGFRLHG